MYKAFLFILSLLLLSQSALVFAGTDQGGQGIIDHICSAREYRLAICQ